MNNKHFCKIDPSNHMKHACSDLYDFIAWGMCNADADTFFTMLDEFIQSYENGEDFRNAWVAERVRLKNVIANKENKKGSSSKQKQTDIEDFIL